MNLFFKPTHPNKWIGLVLASLALAIIIIDGTVLNVSQRDIIETIGVSANQIKALEGFLGIQWATTLYTLVVASLTIWGGRIADKYGKKKIFLLGALLFAVGSLITALSYYWGVERSVFGMPIYGIQILLIGWSVIEGIGAAMMLPATLSLIVSNFEGRERGAAFGIWGATAGFSAALGPLLGGFFTTYFNWSWAFLINVFVVALLILFSGHIVDKSLPQKDLVIDYSSVGLSAFGIIGVTYGLIEASIYGWWKAGENWLSPWGVSYTLPFGLSITPYAIAFGLLLLVLFYVRQRNLTAQNLSALVDLKLFNSKQFNIGLVTLILFSIAFSSLLFALPFYLQVLLGKNAFESGLAFLPFSLASLVVGIVIGVGGRKFDIPAKEFVLVGIGLNAVALAWIGWGLTSAWTVESFILPFILMGIGGGLAQAQLGNLVLSEIESSQSGEASGVQSAVRQLGQTLSTALIGSVFVTVLGVSVVSNIQQLPSVQLPEVQKEIIVERFSSTKPLYTLAPDVQAEAALARNELMKPATLSEAKLKELQGQAALLIPEYIAKEIRESIIDASKSALQTGALFAGLAFVTGLFFNGKQHYKKEEKTTV